MAGRSPQCLEVQQQEPFLSWCPQVLFFQPIDLKQKHGEHGEELSVTEQKAPNTRTDHLGNVISNSCSFHHKMPSHSLLNDTREQKAAL